MPTRVGAFLWSDALHTDLVSTLTSLRRQTLEDFYVVVLGDERARERFAKAYAELGLDGRFSFEPMEAVDAQRIAGLVATRGAETVTFCLAGTAYMEDAFENLYGTHYNGSYGIVVGPVYEGLLNQVQRLAPAHDSMPEFWVENPWSVVRVGERWYPGRIVNPCDSALVRYGFPMGRLFDAALVCEAARKVPDLGVSTFWVLGIACLMMAGEGAVGYTPFDVCAFGGVSVEDDPSLCYTLQALSMRQVPQAFAVAADIERRVTSRGLDEGERERGMDSALLPPWLAPCFAEAIVDMFVSRLWTVDPEQYGELDALVSAARRVSGAPAMDELAHDAGYLAKALRGGKGVETLTTAPELTVVVSPKADVSVVRRHIRTLVSQRCVPFELVLSAGMLPQDDALLRYGFVRAVEGTGSVGQLMGHARGKYALVLEDRMFWVDDAMTRAWRIMAADRVDVAIALPLNGEDNAGCKVMRMPFRQDHCLLNSRSKTNEYDNSLSNKVFRLSALRGKGFSFTDDSAADCAHVYKALDFRRYGFVRLLSEEGDGNFLGRASRWGRLSYRARYLADVVTHVPLWDVAADARLKLQGIRDRRARLQDQVLFFSNRGGEGVLPPNLRAVYDALPEKRRVVRVRSLPHSREYVAETKRLLARSKVIVTDDYLHELMELEVKPGQSIIQLWHAAGAFKKFGLDCFGAPIAKERAIHAHYTAMMVSAEGVRSIYAGAFGIPEERVLALGTPRTDDLFNVAELNSTAERLLASYPDLRGKRVMLYCPTFRQVMSQQVTWDPRVDWGGLSRQMGDEWVLVVKRHPLETSSWGYDAYDNIVQLDNETSNDLMTIADVVVTDYSSVIFDASLLNKPMVFYCPDIDTYDRDFYLDFPDDLPGTLIQRWEDLVPAVRDAVARGTDDERLRTFRERYMGACDGHSAERIADYIRSL